MLCGLLLSLVGLTSAHSIFQEFYVNGVDQGHLTGIRVPTYDGPITDVTSTDLTCNGGPNPLNTPYPTTIIQVPAGATVTSEWHHTLAGLDPSDSQDPIDPSHLGPIMTYLQAVPSALQANFTTTGWFKIWESGLSSNGTWATTTMIANKGKVTYTIPSCIPSGNYFLRHELIALHAASSYPGAQFYMECAQINIVNGGTTQPTTYSIPGIYHPTDPGITIDIYYPVVTNYTIPGPAVFTCPGGASGGGGTPPPPVSTVAPPTSAPPTSTTTPHTTSTTSSAAPSSTSSSGGTSPAYGQCGGTGWTGATACVSGYTCTYSSAYYSQCLP